MKNQLRFKAVPNGSRFTHSGQAFRKASARGAFKINPNGSGQTHALVPFARNTFVAVA